MCNLNLDFLTIEYYLWSILFPFRREDRVRRRVLLYSYFVDIIVDIIVVNL